MSRLQRLMRSCVRKLAQEVVSYPWAKFVMRKKERKNKNKKKKKKEDDEIGLFSVTCSSTPAYSKVRL